jgi:hypothetical protein
MDCSICRCDPSSKCRSCWLRRASFEGRKLLTPPNSQYIIGATSPVRARRALSC